MSNRHTARIPRTCATCNTAFFTYSWALKNGRGRFCSYACRRPRIWRVCETCGTSFTAKPSRLSKGRGRFCSYACAGTFRRLPLETRFQRYIEPANERGCVLWTGCTDPKGYGRIGGSKQGGYYFYCVSQALAAYLAIYWIGKLMLADRVIVPPATGL